MTNPLVIDYAFTHPNPLAIKAAGAIGVVRYLSPDPTKNLTAVEIEALYAAGLDYAMVWESTAQAMLGGAAQGIKDGQRAAELAEMIGAPANQPIYYAADFDATTANIAACAAYMLAAINSSDRPGGLYGDIVLIHGVHQLCPDVAYFWEPEAWNGQVVDSLACLYQRVRPTMTIAPMGVWDEDVVLKADWGQSRFTKPVPILVPPAVNTEVQTMYVQAPDGSVAVVNLWTWQKRHIVPGPEWDVLRKAVTLVPVSQADYDAIPTA